MNCDGLEIFIINSIGTVTQLIFKEILIQHQLICHALVKCNWFTFFMILVFADLQNLFVFHFLGLDLPTFQIICKFWANQKWIHLMVEYVWSVIFAILQVPKVHIYKLDLSLSLSVFNDCCVLWIVDIWIDFVFVMNKINVRNTVTF